MEQQRVLPSTRVLRQHTSTSGSKSRVPFSFIGSVASTGSNISSRTVHGEDRGGGSILSTKMTTPHESNGSNGSNGSSFLSFTSGEIELGSMKHNNIMLAGEEEEEEEEEEEQQQQLQLQQLQQEEADDTWRDGDDGSETDGARGALSTTDDCEEIVVRKGMQNFASSELI